MKSVRIVAVIPTLGKNVERINRAIESVKSKTNHKGLKIIVVNNSGLESIAGLNSVDEVLSPGFNVGYVGALELVRRRYQFDYLWSVQDDMVLLNDSLTPLLKEFESTPNLAVSSPLLVRNGFVPARSRGGVFINPDKTDWANIPFEPVPVENWATEVELSFVSGSGALFSSVALDAIGGFNLELFPLVHVDVEVCAMFLSKGFKLAIVKESHIAHEIQGSTPKLLSEVLDKQNRPLVVRILQNGRPTSSVNLMDLDRDFIESIAKRSSSLLVDVAVLGQAKIDELVKDNQRLLAQRNAIMKFASWAVTRPVRAVKQLFSRRS